MLNASEIYASLSPELATLDVERRRIWRILLPINILFFSFIIAGAAAMYWLLSNQQDSTLDWYVPTFLGGDCLCENGCVKGISNNVKCSFRPVTKQEMKPVMEAMEEIRSHYRNENDVKRYFGLI